MNERAFVRITQMQALIGIVLVLAVAVMIVFLFKEKGTSEDRGNENSTAIQTVSNALQPVNTGKEIKENKANVVMSLTISSDKKEYKLGEPIIIKAVLHKKGGTVTVVKMKELINVYAQAEAVFFDGTEPRKLNAPVGAFIASKPGGNTELEQEIKEYKQLYKFDEKLELFPLKEHFVELPEGDGVLECEIRLDKMIMIYKPCKITLQLEYRNRLDYYLVEGRRASKISWKGDVQSNLLSIEIR